MDRDEAYQKSLEVLKACSTPYGFKAAAHSKDKYDRVWARDSMICALAALMTDDKFLISQAKKSLLTLIKFQHKHGFIPSNVDVKRKKVSYGKSTGRIDAMLWFLVGFGQYVKRTGDRRFLKKYYSDFKRTQGLVHLYEFNDRGFVYVPKGGDWADEYIQEGYVLYDQLLHYRSLQEYIYLRKKMGKSVKSHLRVASDLKGKLVVNYWLEKGNRNSKYVYHKVLFEKALKKKKLCQDYMCPFFNPSEYGWRFDGFANSLALCFDVLPEKKANKMMKFVKSSFSRQMDHLIPAFYPPITKKDDDWDELEENYSIKFRNEPWEYHNGGLWPVITGFFAAGVAKHDKKFAEDYLDGINYANSLTNDGEWGFSEFVNGKTFKPGGKVKQAWSAAAGIIAFETVVNGKKVFL